MPLQQDRRGFGRAIDQQLRGLGRTQDWLAQQITERQGRGRPMSQTTITKWVRGENAPDPETVFAVEELLELPGGALSRFLGYLPVGAVDPPATVVAAVESDVGLTATGRRVVLKVYEELVDDGSDGS